MPYHRSDKRNQIYFFLFHHLHKSQIDQLFVDRHKRIDDHLNKEKIENIELYFKRPTFLIFFQYFIFISLLNKFVQIHTLMFPFFFFTYFISAKRYKENASIPVYGTKVSPYHNPFETYDYFSLPFCSYSGVDLDPPRRLSDAFLGNNPQRTGVTLSFLRPENNTKICSIELNEVTRKKFTKAIESKSYYQLYIDKLPVWSLVGAKGVKDKSQYYVFSRQHFIIYYNVNRIISIILNPESPAPTNSKTIDFSYSVEWIPTNKSKSQRIQNYNNNKFFMQSNPLTSIIWMLLVVCVLMLVAICWLTRSVGDDFNRFQREAEYNDFEIDFHSEKGWKMIHADVFRPPKNYLLLSILFGNGAQIFTAALIYLFLGVIFGNHFSRGVNGFVFVLSYGIAAFVGGYFSAGLYKRWGGMKWINQLVASTFAIPSLFFTIEFIIDAISLFLKTTKISKVKPYIILFLLLIFLILPLSIFGGIIGRHFFIIGPNPTRVSMVRRSIPRQPFYLNNYFLSAVIGLISFFSIYAEIHSLLNAIFQYQVNFVWILALIVLLLLACVVSCSTVFIVYKKLSAEDYEWQWISFIGPFSIAFYIFGYSIYYFMKFTFFSGVSRFLNYFAYFSYTSIFSLTIGTICGFIGFTNSALFVRRIYKNVKAD
ncbi:Transmembrane 9 superfamily member 3 [Tritrichomonas foetus]|uniref:Transmembrane 9 superfamily member n=1 Tax=Tritrichomonas foetus TaxID=1144522 RepID=A0A1J4IZL1_9EUKA|nr:Transmembrane 9 superfamily member 3 [Tritrichomonas foetus]|eukprot:OHS92784.1 Transmembrane 9 superfamily member 3 [Tritrichomonas foetus]